MAQHWADREARIELVKVDIQISTAKLACGKLTDDSLRQQFEFLDTARAYYHNLLLPWEKPLTAEQRNQDAYETYKALIGDPRDPVVKAKMDRQRRILEEQEREARDVKPEEYRAPVPRRPVGQV